MPLDLTNASHLDELYQLADQFLKQTHCDSAALNNLEEQARLDTDTPLRHQVALKLARSKAVVTQQFPVDQPFFVSVLFAVYKENQRILTSKEHPHGEDFLNRKIQQLHWLFDSTPHINWELIVVDDGCPENSGRIAQSIIEKNEHGDKARVLFLQDAIDQNLPVAASLEATSESQKGGAILYGMWDASQKNHGDKVKHVILYTDADLSTHLGQTGLLLEPFLDTEIQAVIGSRRAATSVVVKKGKRNTRGKLFIYLWKRLLPSLGEIIDTQCAFKAFNADLARNIILNAIEKKFAFDIELLLKTEQQFAGATHVIPVAWIDSEAASTTTDLEPYLPMLRSTVSMYRSYLPANDKAEPFANFIESLTQDSWEHLANHVPAQIAECDPSDLGKTEIISAEELMDIST